MSDLSSQIFERLVKHRLPGFDWEDERIHPYYEGGSILNLPASVCHWLSAPPFGHAPLFPELLNAFGNGIQQVVLVLVDGLGWDRMRQWMEVDSLTPWKELARTGVLVPLTSIVPSTTATAMTSLWTGCSPAEHAIVGYELLLKEYGVVANMILHKPMSFKEDNGSLRRAGFSPRAFLGLPTLGTHLAANGVEVYAFHHYTIARSGLSEMFLQDVEIRSFGTTTNLWINLRDLLNLPSEARRFIWVYWSEVDHYSHSYGPDNERTQAEFRAFSQTFQDLLFRSLTPAARQGTLFILMSDHGQIATPKNPHFDLRNHAEFVRRLHLLPTGENRLIYLYPRSGQLEAVRAWVEKTWDWQFTSLHPIAAVNRGLFGPGKPHPRLLDRLGDLILVSRGDAYLWWGAEENPLLGRHGGLSPEEMLVPFLGARLD